MAGFFKKLFGGKEDAAAKQPEPQMSEAELKIAEISEEVLNQTSKGKAISADMDKLREEIRQKEAENRRLLDEYESLEDGLEKEMVMGRLTAYEDELEGLRRRVAGLSQAWGRNAKLIQTLKQARERIREAIAAGKSPGELTPIIEDIACLGEELDDETSVLMGAGNHLGGTTAGVGTDANREKVLAKLAARKGAKAPSARQESSTQAHETAGHPGQTTSAGSY